MKDNLGEWIPAESELPVQGQRVLATLRCKGKLVVAIITYALDFQTAEGCKLEAWMPVPTPFRSDIARMYILICKYMRSCRENYKN